MLSSVFYIVGGFIENISLIVRCLISANQHGFRKKRSCMTQLLSHVEQIYKSLKDDKEVDVIYLDLPKHSTK